MTRHVRSFVPALLVASLVALWVTACKQQEGERCQINMDCEDGLTCNQATFVCSREGANTMIDANLPDVIQDAPVDVAIDAPVDAPPDTM